MSTLTTSPLNNNIIPQQPPGSIATPVSSLHSPNPSNIILSHNKQQQLLQQQPSQPLAERTKKEVDDSLRLIEDLKFFLATAPANWQENQVIRRYYLNHDEGFVSCVFWNNLYFVTGTDIVRCIVYKFEHFGRKILDRKKFEEGIFSDLRNLKCNIDAILEPPRSEFLEFLFKNSCLRTQKKQKVFFWFNVPHDKLMADALERDLKKEKAGQKPTTIAHREPALSFNFDESSNLYNQLVKHMDTTKNLLEMDESDEENNIQNFVRVKEEVPPPITGFGNQLSQLKATKNTNDGENNLNTQSTKLDGKKISKSLLDDEELSDDEEDTTNDSTTNNINETNNNNNTNSSDYEDDFPLDYFEPQHNSDDYITLDSNNYQDGEYPHVIGPNYDQLFENQIFSQPITSQVASNTEYLIEQTQPLKTPLPPISSIPPPKSSATTKFFQSNAEYYNQLQQQHTNQPLPPLSAKLQTSFNKSNNQNSLPPPPIHLPSQNQMYPENSQQQNYYQQPPPPHPNYSPNDNVQYYKQQPQQQQHAPPQPQPPYYDANSQPPYYPNQQYPQQQAQPKQQQQPINQNGDKPTRQNSTTNPPMLASFQQSPPPPSNQPLPNKSALPKPNRPKMPLAAQHPAMTKQQAVSTKMQLKKKQMAAAAAAAQQKSRGRGRPPNVVKKSNNDKDQDHKDKDKKHRVSIQDVIGSKATKVVDKK
ncbi:STE12 [Candida jiufengensis]|uniref:STE12 n=1 Tax=Candida jiufengensis TaxID=497108 RepID=UPI00222439C7|nr:STE12 [Candida jiufengensis]KAI5951955.1 STE12 [Candida jiufengensis]